MSAYVIVEDKRFWIGEGLVELSISEDYGFVPTTAQITLDYKALMARLPNILRRKPEDRVPVFAAITLDDNEVEEYSGFLEDNSGENSVFGADPDTVQIASRSVLALLQDEEPDGKNRVTAHYLDKDWGYVLREIVKPYGFKLGRIQAGGPAGEERSDKSHFLSLDKQLPGEIITQAVSATGYVANATPQKEFVFAPSLVSPEQLPIQFEFKKFDPTSTIDTYRFGNTGITQITSKRLLKIVPGSLIRVTVYSGMRDNDVFLSGNYYGTQVAYKATKDPQQRGIAVTLLRELPQLKAEEGE